MEWVYSKSNIIFPYRKRRINTETQREEIHVETEAEQRLEGCTNYNSRDIKNSQLLPKASSEVQGRFSDSPADIFILEL